jgi:hypothetical protein
LKLSQPFFISIFLLFAVFIASIFKLTSFTTSDAKGIFNVCQKEFNKDICYLKEFSKLTNYSDFNQVYKILLSVQELDPATRNCHLIAHTIATNETKKNPNNWRGLLSQMDANACNGGFIHGVIEEKHLLDPNFILDKTTIPQICQTVKDINQAEEATCIHIMGHLILLDNLGDLKKASDTCLQLPQKHQDRCLGGVFMEYEIRDNLTAHGILSPIKWSEQTIIHQENICQGLTGLLAKACLRELSRVYILVYPNNPQKIYENCFKSPDKEAALECYTHSMGFIAASINTPLEELKPLCSPLLSDAHYFLYCVMYVNSYMLINSLKFIDRATFICQNVPQIHKTSCFNILAQSLKKIAKKEELIKLCQSNIPLESRTYCNE